MERVAMGSDHCDPILDQQALATLKQCRDLVACTVIVSSTVESISCRETHRKQEQTITQSDFNIIIICK